MLAHGGAALKPYLYTSTCVIPASDGRLETCLKIIVLALRRWGVAIKPYLIYRSVCIHANDGRLETWLWVIVWALGGSSQTLPSKQKRVPSMQVMDSTRNSPRNGPSDGWPVGQPEGQPEGRSDTQVA